MKSVVGAFASSRVRERFDDDLHAGVESALSYYGQRLAAGLVPIEPHQEIRNEVEPPLVEVELSPAGAGLVAAEARRLGVTTEMVLNHALLLYLADLDRPFKAAAEESSPGSR